MRILSWNVNGIRAVMKKGFKEWVVDENPDVLCLQETKIHTSQLEKAGLKLEGYNDFWSCAEKKGYSGVGLYTKQELIGVTDDLGRNFDDKEGRILKAKHPEFTLYNIYFPNGQSGDERLKYKLDFYDRVIEIVKKEAERGEKIIICGDYNTAHHPIDLKNPKANEDYSGFMPIERERLDHLTESGFVDVYRYFYPDKVQYTWWTYRFKARQRNIGWRIDYFFVSENMIPLVKEVRILEDILGSDHCPIELKLNL